jgi:hypothetical protein
MPGIDRFDRFDMPQDARQLLDVTPELVQFRRRALHFDSILDLQSLITRNTITVPFVVMVDTEEIVEGAMAAGTAEKEACAGADKQRTHGPLSEDSGADERAAGDDGR